MTPLETFLTIATLGPLVIAIWWAIDLRPDQRIKQAIAEQKALDRAFGWHARIGPDDMDDWPAIPEHHSFKKDILEATPDTPPPFRDWIEEGDDE